jgi:outer membrane murein-binding lipoprotein Lpp
MEWIKRFAYLLIVLLMIGTIVVAGCNNNQATRNDYQKAVQTLVNYRNQIVKGAIKQNNSALK